MKYTTMIATIAAAGAAAHAGTFFSEIEDNNSLATANDLGSFGSPGGSITVDGALSEGDVDWFAFSLDNTATLSFFAGFAAGGADGILQIVDAGGDVLAFDDDNGIGFMPAVQLENLAAGDYFVGFSGFGDVFSDSVDTDELADGLGHSEDFGYKLTIGFTIIPAPGAMALLGMGGLVIARRRR